MVRSSERLTVTRTTVRQAWRLSTMAMYGRGGTTAVWQGQADGQAPALHHLSQPLSFSGEDLPHVRACLPQCPGMQPMHNALPIPILEKDPAPTPPSS